MSESLRLALAELDGCPASCAPPPSSTPFVRRQPPQPADPTMPTLSPQPMHHPGVGSVAGSNTASGEITGVVSSSSATAAGGGGGGYSAASHPQHPPKPPCLLNAQQQSTKDGAHRPPRGMKPMDWEESNMTISSAAPKVSRMV